MERKIYYPFENERKVYIGIEVKNQVDKEIVGYLVNEVQIMIEEHKLNKDGTYVVAKQTITFSGEWAEITTIIQGHKRIVNLDFAKDFKGEGEIYVVFYEGTYYIVDRFTYEMNRYDDFKQLDTVGLLVVEEENKVLYMSELLLNSVDNQFKYFLLEMCNMHYCPDITRMFKGEVLETNIGEELDNFMMTGYTLETIDGVAYCESLYDEFYSYCVIYEEAKSSRIMEEVHFEAYVREEYMVLDFDNEHNQHLKNAITYVDGKI